MTRRKTEQARRYSYDPDYAVPPGETLQETIDALGISQAELAKRAGLSVKHTNQIIKGVAPITQETAIRLERVTGVSARMWNNLESNYREQLVRLEERKRFQTDLEWLKTIPTKDLVARGVIKEPSDRLELLQQVLRFFGVATVDAWKDGWEKPQFAFRKSPAIRGEVGAMATWLRLCELQAEDIQCAPYDRAKLKTVLEGIRSLTVEIPHVFVPAMIHRCAAAGVAVALVPEIKKAPVSGAAKWLTPSKAMIGLNLRGKRNDIFWFTFFHEAGHILNDSKRQTYVDVDYEDDPREHKANRFASNLLIPARYEQELPCLKSYAAVERFAASIGIAPGIVAGRLQRDGIIPHSHLNRLIVRLEWAAG